MILVVVDYPVLATVVDDSGTNRQSNPFVLAGFVAPLERWQNFSTKWGALLDSYHLSCFKLKKIKTQRYLDRALKFVDVIRENVDLGVNYTLFHDDYVAVVKGKVEEKLDNPFAWCLFALVAGVARFADTRPEYAEHTIAFVFDDTTERARIERMWDDALCSLDESVRRRMASKPLFVPDEEFTPLQAAHALAWSVRDHMDESIQLGKWASEKPVYREMLKISFLSKTIARKELEEWLSTTREAYALMQADKGPKDQARVDRVKKTILERRNPRQITLISNPRANRH